MFTTYRRTSTIVKQMTDFIQEQTADLENDILWWETRVKVVQEWLKANPLRIGVPDDGTIETITQQIARGDKHVQIRVKAWKHIVAELDGIPGVCTKFTGAQAPTLADPVDVDQSSDENPPSNNDDELVPPPHDAGLESATPAVGHSTPSPMRGKLRAHKAKSSAAVLESTPPPVVNQQEEPVAKHPPMLEKKSLSQLSMMDRQQEWLRKKAEKAAAEKQRQQEEADKELTFQPALKKSTGPRPSSQAAQQPSPAVAAAEPAKPRTKSADRHRKQPGNQKPPLKATSSLLDSVRAELTASSASTPAVPVTKPVAASASPPSNLTTSSSVDTTVALVAKALESVGKMPAPPPSKPEDVVHVERRFQFDTGSNESKARFQLQDPSLFDLTSIYRKKDKYARRDGVSLQMGRRDDTRDEQIIAVLFDREHFASEHEAGEWFADHKQRLMSYMS